ncbi:uncharacterized protein LOC124941633 [Impatiens glandulifera]|uniref:uncharacterized protein LOC124941633 n=1 Tax=Impatiens glandulifera TaxID=253017 RepID=UPI001FB05B94|nr:uncharacterized protein LOC124941633 [Impatiens glandulifera]
MTWNIRDINDPIKSKEIRKIIDDQKLTILGILETKVKDRNVDRIKCLCMDSKWGLLHNSNNRTDSIWVIMVEAKSKIDDNSFRLAIVYGINSITDRSLLWRCLKDRIDDKDPWAVLGDFNVTMAENERSPDSDFIHDMIDFNDCIRDIGCVEPTNSGNFFTWSSMRGDEHIRRSRIDRGLINASWAVKYPMSHIHVLNPGISDHCPIKLFWEKDKKMRHTFKFFNFWMDKSNFKSILNEVWSTQVDGSNMFMVSENLRLLKNQLVKFDRRKFSNISKRVMAAREVLDEAQKDNADFVQGQDQIQDLAVQYYQGLMGTKAGQQYSHLNTLYQIVDKRISVDDSRDLIRVVSREEVWKALTNINGNKSPGPDGFNAEFFKVNWDIVGHDITEGNILKGYGKKRISPQGAFKIDIRKAFDFVNAFLPPVSLCVSMERTLATSKAKVATVITLSTLSTRRRRLLTFVLLTTTRADVDTVKTIKDAINFFYDVTCLLINEEKSAAFYGGVNDEIKARIQDIMGISEGSFSVRYLGILLTVRQIHVVHCRPLIEKVKNVIMGWATKKLSYAGRIELVGSVVMGLIGYWSQQIVLPKKVMQELDTLLRDFIWGTHGRGGKKSSGLMCVNLRMKEVWV